MTENADLNDSFWARVRGLFRRHLGPEPAVVEATHPLNQLLDPLDQLRHQALLQQAQARDVSQQQAQHDEQQRQQEEQQALQDAILVLHQKLRTGLGASELERMAESLRQHCHNFRAPRSDELSEIAMLSVMVRLHREALEWAWSEFVRRLEEAGLSWPEPTGLAPHADESERLQHRQMHLAQVYQSFVAGSFLRFADLMLGVVPAWRTLFPQRGGAVWTESAYEAVAGALAVSRLFQLEAVAEKDKLELERLIAQELAGQLAPLQQRLTAGVGSIMEARNLSDQAVAVCQRVAPDVVWAHLSRQLTTA